MKKIGFIFLFFFSISSCAIADKHNTLSLAYCAANNFLIENKIPLVHSYILESDRRVTIIFYPDQRKKGGKIFEKKITELKLNSLFDIYYSNESYAIGFKLDCKNISFKDIQL